MWMIVIAYFAASLTWFATRLGQKSKPTRTEDVIDNIMAPPAMVMLLILMIVAFVINIIKALVK